MSNQRQLFCIDGETMNSLGKADVQATVKGLKELGLYHLPYKTVSIRILQRDALTIKSPSEWRVKQMLEEHNNLKWVQDAQGWWRPTNLGEEHTIEFRDLGTETFGTVWLVSQGSIRWKPYEFLLEKTYEATQEHMRDILVTLLATKNTVKSTVVDKLAKLGLCKGKAKHRYTYVTTISRPKSVDLEDATEGPEQVVHGSPKAAHLRRGHVRHQPYGPRKAFTRAIWIEPMWINGDEEFVNSRERYNVKL